MKEKFDSLVEHLLDNGFFLEEAVELLEKELIGRAMGRTKGNRSAASKLLGIHRNTLQRKCVEYKMETGSVRRKPPRSAQAARRRARIKIR
jgi:transcriptional regulator with PAS, ATPase and Fis domain